MNKIIVIDIGNTNTKISLCNLDKENIIQTVIVKNSEFTKSEKNIINFFNKNKNLKIVIGSVCYDAFKKIYNLLIKKLNITKKNICILKQKDFSSLKSSLTEPEKNIGLDVLSLSYYISYKYKNGVGFSFGTVSFVTVVKNNTIVGATIAPSFYENFANIANEASMIKSSTTKEFNKGFGLDTKSALESGYFHIINGFIQSIIKTSYDKFKIDNFIFCGGINFPIKIIASNKDYKYYYNEKQLITLGYLLIYKKININ